MDKVLKFSHSCCLLCDLCERLCGLCVSTENLTAKDAESFAEVAEVSEGIFGSQRMIRGATDKPGPTIPNAAIHYDRVPDPKQAKAG